jgi:iron-sulfur cluster assembly protein
MFTWTGAAARQVQMAASNSGTQEMALRIAARLDTDGGVQFGMGFDEAKEEDLMLDFHGVAVVIGGESQQLLDDVVLDWVELEPGAFNFIFMDAQTHSAEAEANAGGCGTGCGSGGCASRGCGSTGSAH